MEDTDEGSGHHLDQSWNVKLPVLGVVGGTHLAAGPHGPTVTTKCRPADGTSRGLWGRTASVEDDLEPALPSGGTANF